MLDLVRGQVLVKAAASRKPSLVASTHTLNFPLLPCHP